MVYHFYGSNASIRILRFAKNSWRNLVRMDNSLTYRQFELLSVRTNVLITDLQFFGPNIYLKKNQGGWG